MSGLADEFKVVKRHRKLFLVLLCCIGYLLGLTCVTQVSTSLQHRGRAAGYHLSCGWWVGVWVVAWVAVWVVRVEIQNGVTS